MIGEQKPETREQIAQIFDSLREVVLEKNRRYGDSALVPIGVFNKAGPELSILARLDDKLGRVVNSPEPAKNDVADIIGYLVLYATVKGWHDFSDQLD